LVVPAQIRTTLRDRAQKQRSPLRGLRPENPEGRRGSVEPGGGSDTRGPHPIIKRVPQLRGRRREKKESRGWLGGDEQRGEKLKIAIGFLPSPVAQVWEIEQRFRHIPGKRGQAVRMPEAESLDANRRGR